jgi:RNA polymerase primary sigma factor
MRPDGRPAIPDDDEEDTTLSLAAMEEVLKPAALEKFAEITATYKKFLKLQETRLSALASTPPSRRRTSANIRSCARN